MDPTFGIDWGKSIAGANKEFVVADGGSWDSVLLKNAHLGLPDPEAVIVRCSLVAGECLYFHYYCDGQDDRGWGCGYRTLQTLSSWLCLSGTQQTTQKTIPSLIKIQQALVDIGDKPSSFLGSREWIGTFEAGLVLDHLYNIPCRILHVRGGDLELNGMTKELHQHFETWGSPVMMGGDKDNSSKGILGVCTGTQESHLLVLDPHYHGPPLDREQAQQQGWVSWKSVSTLDQSSFYNLCLLQTVCMS